MGSGVDEKPRPKRSGHGVVSHVLVQSFPCASVQGVAVEMHNATGEQGSAHWKAMSHRLSLDTLLLRKQLCISIVYALLYAVVGV